MSPANIYKSFPSKDAIIQAVAEQELAELIKSIETAVSSSSGALARIEALALAIFHWHRELLRQESQLFQLGVGPLAFEAPAVFTGDEPTGSICCRRRPGRLDETGGERGRRRRHGGGVHPPIPEGGINTVIKSKRANLSRLPTDATSIWTPQNAVFRQVCFASDQSFARKAVRETGTRRCRQNTYASCIRQHRVKEHDVLIGDQGHGVSCGTWCVSVAGEANFAPAWDRKAATIRTSSTWWRPAKASCWRRNFCSRKPWRGCARLRSRRGSWPGAWLCPCSNWWRRGPRPILRRWWPIS